jgi:hypothetical protein
MCAAVELTDEREDDFAGDEPQARVNRNTVIADQGRHAHAGGIPPI